MVRLGRGYLGGTMLQDSQETSQLISGGGVGLSA